MRVCVWFVTAVSVSYIFLRCSVSHYVSLLFTFIYSLPAILAKTASGCQISVAMCATFQPFFCEPNAVPVVAGSASVASRPGVGLTNSFMLLLPTNSMGWGVPHFLKHVGRLMPPSFEVLGSVASCNRSDSAGVIATDGHWFAERTMCGIASEKVPVDVRDKASRHFPVFACNEIQLYRRLANQFLSFFVKTLCGHYPPVPSNVAAKSLNWMEV